ncbi:hypothetical protein E3N88_13781 [Mikania micrantha]|uniref:Uncharacterized protein n=1 Tax=Mikania micrantha TaxID=192012 RepID=A0A5N6P194_9ASTR|nr:hypothetical protein E3N88_13781 [Mikania micrantha]
MADQGERYIYQRFPYVLVDDTPSSSSGSDSDPSEAVSLASHTSTVPPIPPLPEPVPVPPPPALPIIPSPPHSPPAEPVADQRQSITPPRVPAWDGLRRLRGQARKTTGLPPRHQMAPRDEPQAVHEGAADLSGFTGPETGGKYDGSGYSGMEDYSGGETAEDLGAEAYCYILAAGCGVECRSREGESVPGLVWDGQF